MFEAAPVLAGYGLGLVPENTEAVAGPACQENATDALIVALLSNNAALGYCPGTRTHCTQPTHQQQLGKTQQSNLPCPLSTHVSPVHDATL